jgi:hypothetical protein
VFANIRGIDGHECVENLDGIREERTRASAPSTTLRPVRRPMLMVILLHKDVPA